jgi:hypothetical protein
MNSPEPKVSSMNRPEPQVSSMKLKPVTPVMTLFLDLLDSYQTLSREEAEQLHRKLGRLNFSRNEHYLLAQQLTGREIKSFTTLTQKEADDLLELAEQQNSVRQMVKPAFVSDEEALAVLY